jgi:O-acetylserine/cysteine efflux transporter
MTGRYLLLVLLVCLVWAFNFLAGSKGVEVFSPQLFMALRFVLVLALTWPFLRAPAPGHWPRLATACITIGALHFTFMFWALQRSSDITSIVILQHMFIPMSVLLAIPILGERAGWRTLAAVGVASAGVLVIGFDPMVLGQLDALGLALISAFFQALGSVFMRGVRGVSVMGFQAWSAVFSLPLLVLAILVSGEPVLDQFRTAGAIHWASVAYSALIASLVGHGIFFYLVQRNPLPTVMPYMLMTPIFGALFGMLVWGDHPGPRLLLGGVMVMMGLLVVTLRGRAKAAVMADGGD